ncbi:hypothetical protein ACFX13_022117 [Malus domestica]
MYVPKHRSTLEFFISNSYGSMCMEAIPLLRRGFCKTRAELALH